MPLTASIILIGGLITPGNSIIGSNIPNFLKVSDFYINHRLQIVENGSPEDLMIYVNKSFDPMKDMSPEDRKTEFRLCRIHLLNAFNRNLKQRAG